MYYYSRASAASKCSLVRHATDCTSDDYTVRYGMCAEGTIDSRLDDYRTLIYRSQGEMPGLDDGPQGATVWILGEHAVGKGEERDTEREKILYMGGEYLGRWWHFENEGTDQRPEW